MSNLPILRTKCSVDYTTPSNTTLNLPINCAASDSNDWPWNYFWTKTIGTATPILSNGTSRASGSFQVDGKSVKEQVVIRGIFAYIATDPLSATISCNALMQKREDDPPELDPKYTLKAVLYEPNGSPLSTFFDVTTSNASATVTLPATVCPKILWVGAAVQPIGADSLPPCSAKIIVSVS
jgi:hypothetical protein